MFAKKTCAVVKARIGTEEVAVTALPTRYCANLHTKKDAVRTRARRKMLPAAQYINFTHTVRGTLSFCSPTDHQELSRPIYFERVCECYISSVLRDRPIRTAESQTAVTLPS